ncbi:MAG: hypothetical protein HOH33_17710 [Verrucomicrobia bacterium]|nr:hypothetical protein [Verrucomicrobiota bacterium]
MYARGPAAADPYHISIHSVDSFVAEQETQTWVPSHDGSATYQFFRMKEDDSS